MIVSIRILPNPPKSLQSYTIFGLNSSDSYSVISTNGVITCNITSPTSPSYTLHCECIPKDLTERNFSLFNKNSNISNLDYFLDLPEVDMKILSQNANLFESLKLQIGMKSCQKVGVDLDIEYRSMDVLPNMINLWEYVATRKVEIDGKEAQQLDLGCENFASPGFYRVRIRDLDDDKVCFSR